MKWRPLWLTDRQLRVAEAEVLPPWYYGAGYRDYASRVTAFYPMPFNYLVRFKFWLAWAWSRKRDTCGEWMPRSDYQPTLESAYRRGYIRGEMAGHNRGYNDAAKELKQLAGIDDD